MPATLLAFALSSFLPVLAQGGTPDQVVRVNERNGRSTTLAGTVTKATLESVELEAGGKVETIPGSEVRSITWGEVPAAFADGRTYAGRGDWPNAAAKYRQAASDAATRPVLQAAARLEAAEALLAWGARDPNQYAECIAECERFLADHPTHRDLPQARWVKARATHLSGQPAEAAAQFRALYQEGTGEPRTVGYDREFCILAGLDAAWAYLDAGETGPAREIFVGIESPIAALLAKLDGAAGPSHARLESARGVAAAGEGFCLLAGGQHERALSFFEPRAADAAATPAARQASTLGLAESLAALGRPREAQIHFARVSATDYSSRDRKARALVGLAETTMALGDREALASAKLWLSQVLDEYGDTPAARKARELTSRL